MKKQDVEENIIPNLELEVFSEELKKIESDRVRNFTIEALNLVPAYFWTNPSSTSGKYHPPDEAIKGGLVLHAKRCFRLCEHLWGMENEEYNEFKDLLLSASLLHDCWKSGLKGKEVKREGGISEFGMDELHHIYSFIALKPIQEKYSYQYDWICGIISFHTGRWAVFETKLSKEIEHLGKMLHIADYICSRNDVEVKIGEKRKVWVLVHEDGNFWYLNDFYPDICEMYFNEEYANEEFKSQFDGEPLYEGKVKVAMYELSDFSQLLKKRKEKKANGIKSGTENKG